MHRRESGMHRVVTAGLSLVLSLACAGEGVSATAGTAASGNKEVPMSAGDLLRPEDAARAFADAPRAVVKMPNGRSVVAVVADTPERTMYGYMFRREVKDDEGMVFVYPEAGMHPFWMKNTLVPLDIIWMDEAFEVLHVETAPPCKADPCPSYGTPRISRYTLELKAGSAARDRLRVGDRLSIAFAGDGAAR
jgi:uncharacterized membrane protein (UPF0127 family)